MIFPLFIFGAAVPVRILNDLFIILVQGLQNTFQKLTLMSVVIYGEFDGLAPH